MRNYLPHLDAGRDHDQHQKGEDLCFLCQALPARAADDSIIEHEAPEVLGNCGTEFRSLSFNIPDELASQPASKKVVHAVREQVVLMHTKSSRAGGQGSVPDLFLPT